jgi:glycosyltransferase involved in cell wall biosynthesis
VDRYPYLRTLLAQLRQQTVQALEIIIVDQTAADRRQPELFAEFGDLPLRVIYQDEPGQCTSRNAGLQMAKGDYILFIDDDDEVKSDLIELHLQTLAEFRAEVSSGVADEVGAGSLPDDFCLLRASDVFPTNNTMIDRNVLRRSGLFDLAYNRRQRADGDLGMRIYLSGATMILNPAISVLHHHAPSGGLRNHKARTVTYAMSRNKVFCRTLASVSEFYLARRYFPSAHQREMPWQSLLGTFSIRGGLMKSLIKIAVSTAFLPQSIARLRSRDRAARDLAKTLPQIPKL